MEADKRIIDNFSSLPALITNGRRQPDRRQFSKRWLIGTFIIGATSAAFMLIALFAALNGRTQLATPPELMSLYDLPGANPEIEGQKGNRIALTLPKQTFVDRQEFQFSTQEKQGDKILIRTEPYEMLHMMLAEKRNTNYKYPKFNILNIFSDAGTANGNAITSETLDTTNKLDSKITSTLTPFYPENISFLPSEEMGNDEAQRDIHLKAFQLTDGLTHYELAPYQKYKNDALLISERPDIRIIQENVSVAAKSNYTDDPNYYEDIIPIDKDQQISDALTKNNYDAKDIQNLASVFDHFLPEDALTKSGILRIGLESDQNSDNHIVRVSLYHGIDHIITIALDDNNNFALGQPPEMTNVLKRALSSGIPIRRIARKLPTVYDAIYRSVLSYGLPQHMADQLVRIVATDVDLESRVSPDASLDVFYPLKDAQATNTENKRDIVYVSAKFGSMVKKYYRFQATDGTVSYYDSEGRSSKQFLLRKPVPNGIFRSPFGSRRHPILGYIRMHTGVDWAAPRGSPIIAAGDGIVTKIGLSRSYGNHTEIQHANGYLTSYSHQSGFAPGIKKGTHVKQGQVIGYVGSTGLSTGPHCHFEVVVNGTKVDPMRVRIPQSKELKANELLAFKYERDQIDVILSSQSMKRSPDITETEENDEN